MTDHDLIAEYNATGCRGCVDRWSLRPDQVRWRIKRLRDMGHELRRWPRTGRPRVNEQLHAVIRELCKAEFRTEISRVTGLTIGQVRHACEKVGRR